MAMKRKLKARREPTVGVLNEKQVWCRDLERRIRISIVNKDTENGSFEVKLVWLATVLSESKESESGLVRRVKVVTGLVLKVELV